MKSLSTLERDLADAVLGAELPGDLRGQRQSVYRRLVRANLDDVIGSLLPRTAARGGARFWEEVGVFYATRGPQTHYLRDVPSELLAWAKERWAIDESLPPYLHDLGRHEIATMEIGSAPGDDVRSARGEISLDAPAVFAEGAQLRRYQHAVHELPEDTDDRSPPARREVALLVYRDASHALRYLELTKAAAAILELLLDGTPVGESITRGAASASVPVDTSLLEGTSRLLADLAERGVLLGSA